MIPYKFLWNIHTKLVMVLPEIITQAMYLNSVFPLINPSALIMFRSLKLRHLLEKREPLNSKPKELFS